MNRDDEHSEQNAASDRENKDISSEIHDYGEIADLIQTMLKDIQLINTAGQQSPEMGEEMLSLVVDQALQGVDIAQRYPGFYQQLLQDRGLREAFIDALVLMEGEAAAGEAPVFSAPVDLSFLTREGSPRQVFAGGRDHWRVNWRRSAGDLQQIMFPAGFAARSDMSLYDDPKFTLLRDELEIEGALVAVELEGSLSVEVSDTIDVDIFVAVTDSATKKDLSLPLGAALVWGTFEGETMLSEQGEGKYRAVPFSAILGEENQTVTSDLQVVLFTTPQ